MRRYVVKLRPAHGPESCGVILRELESARHYIKGLDHNTRTSNLGAVIYSMIDPHLTVDFTTGIKQHEYFAVAGKGCEEVEFVSFTSPSLARPA